MDSIWRVEAGDEVGSGLWVRASCDSDPFDLYDIFRDSFLIVFLTTDSILRAHLDAFL